MARLLITILLVLKTALALGQARDAAHSQEPIHLDIRLMGADLIDEMVFDWSKNPPLPERAAIALSGVDAPLGLDDRFAVFVENRLYELLQINADIPIDLVVCPSCRKLMVSSNPKRTIVSRGVDQPEVLGGILSAHPGRLALQLGFEAEGKELVMRAQIFELKGIQKIIWARTYTTSMSSRRLLRESSPLISLEQAREEQRIVLENRDPLALTTRMTVRSFSVSGTVAGANVTAPLIFIEQAFEGILLPKRNRRMGLTLGFTSIKDSLTGWSAGGQYQHLLWRERPSLIHPDLYLVVGMHYIRLRGPQAAVFGQGQLDVATIIDAGVEPKASLVAWRLGLESHIKHRYGFITFLEYIPLLNSSETLAKDTLLGIPYHNFGGGLVIRW